MEEKESSRRRNILKRILQSKTLNRSVKTMVLGALLSGKSMNGKAAEVQVKDAEVAPVERTTEAMPSSRIAEQKITKLQKFSEIPELPIEQTSLVNRTYIVDHNAWIEHDRIVVKCVDARYVQDLSLTDVACARECKALPKNEISEDGYITFHRDPGVIGNDGKATYNGIISTDFNATKQSIVLMYCSNNEKIVRLAEQMINGDHKAEAEKIRRQIYHNDSTIASPEELKEIFVSKEFLNLKRNIKNLNNRAAFNRMYQRVCRSDVESSLDFQEQYALIFYGIGRGGNLNRLNQKIKQVNGANVDLTKVRPVVIAAALSEMIAKGHGTLTNKPMMLKLQMLNNVSSATNITNARVLGPAARAHADKMAKYDYLTLKMVTEMFDLTNNLRFYEGVKKKIQEHEQKIDRYQQKMMEQRFINTTKMAQDALKIDMPNTPRPIKIDPLPIIIKNRGRED